MEFTDREFQIIHDSEFLITKAGASSKIQHLLSEVKVGLKDVVKKSRVDPELMKLFSSGKISKGENYRGLPYQVLDYPAAFHKHDIFAFRTMFWWGNYFSCTLHLQGKPLEIYRQTLIDNLDHFTIEDLYVCVNESPWEYHFEADNYKLITKADSEYLNKCQFLKLSKKIEICQWKKLPVSASNFLEQLLATIFSK